jgi:hypothetical protein
MAKIAYLLTNGRAVDVRFVDDDYEPTAGETILEDRDTLPTAEELIPTSLDDMKAAKNAKINQWRLEENSSTFPHAGKMFTCDPLSRSDIDGVANHIALFNEFPPAFPGEWKAVDNTVLEMPTIADFKAFYQSMTAQGTANFNHAQELKQVLFDAATDAPQKIDAIVW